MNYTEVKELAESLNENDAMTLFHAMQDKFGWSGSPFTQEDARQTWVNEGYEDRFPWDDHDIWSMISGSYQWDWLSNAQDHDWDSIRDAAIDAFRKLSE